VNERLSPGATSSISDVNCAIAGSIDLPPALRNASAQFDARLSRSMVRRNFIVTRFGWRESITRSGSFVGFSR
jgi:hypothetical protein